MAYTPPPVATKEYRDWAIEPNDDRRYLGSIPPEGTPLLYHPGMGTVYRGRVDPEAQRIVSDDEPSWDLGAEETIGQFVERIGDETGWDSLSEWANEHLESEDGSER